MENELNMQRNTNIVTNLSLPASNLRAGASPLKKRKISWIVIPLGKAKSSFKFKMSFVLQQIKDAAHSPTILP